MRNTDLENSEESDICLILNLFIFLDQGCQTSRTKMTVSIA